MWRRCTGSASLNCPSQKAELEKSCKATSLAASLSKRNGPSSNSSGDDAMRFGRWLVFVCENKILFHELISHKSHELSKIALDSKNPTCVTVISSASQSSPLDDAFIAVGCSDGAIRLISFSTFKVKLWKRVCLYFRVDSGAFGCQICPSDVLDGGAHVSNHDAARFRNAGRKSVCLGSVSGNGAGWWRVSAVECHQSARCRNHLPRVGIQHTVLPKAWALHTR